uniref:Uncharacterized protein n=1 Tax=Lepeophtheirus salmonis TaxID=72036 RepID=A0A0K2U3S4_LEPSM
MVKVEVARIMDTVKCSRSLVFNVANMNNDEEDLFKKTGSEGHNLKKDPEFLSSFEKKIKEYHIKSMNRLTNDLSVATRTIMSPVKDDVGLPSYMRTQHHLLTEIRKATRLER